VGIVFVRPRLVFVVLFLISVALASAGQATATLPFDARWGVNYLEWGQCCSSAGLYGTRTYISTTSISPDSTQCVVFSTSVADSLALGNLGQLQVGDVKCGANSGGLDLMCSTSGAFVKFVERLPHSHASGACYPHGAVATGENHLFTVDDSNGDGTYHAYIDGLQYEGQSGYATNGTQDVLQAWGEHTNSTSCTGWGGTAVFTTWQRYNLPINQWVTIGSSEMHAGCWSLGAVTNGNFSVGH
jgi:hypothetical protein